MINKIFFPVLLLLLAYGLWLSNEFTLVTAGVAIFLFGILALKQGFQGFSGGTLESVLRFCTNKLWKSLSFGLISATLMQSSSLVSVITISFLSVGLLDLTSGIGVIFGANLGTTASSWLIAGFGLKVKIASYAMPMMIFGVLFIFQQNKTLKALGSILVGMGFLFLGMHYMKEGFSVTHEDINLKEYSFSGVKGLLLFTLMGIITTVIIQSSSATMAIIITALSAQQISYENAMVFAIGANIGTTITAIIGSIGVNIEGKRLAAAHLIFNLVTACVALLLLKQFVLAVDYLAEQVNIAPSDYTLRLALFHSLFNTAGIVILIPFIKPLVRLIEKILRGQSITVDQPKYLSNAVMTFPDSVIMAIQQETMRLYNHASHIILKTLGFSTTVTFSEQDLKQLLGRAKIKADYDVEAAYDLNIKGIYSAIIAFISQVNASSELHDSDCLYQLREANRHIVEAIKDTKHLQKNLLLQRKSKNPFVKQEYNNIRLQIAELIRSLEEMRIQAKRDNTDIDLLSFDVFKAKIKEQDQYMNIKIDELIREHKISPDNGSSLINDSAYMLAIKSHLVAAAETIFVVQPAKALLALQELALDDNELVKVIQSEN